MAKECDTCGYRPARRCAAHRRELLQCEACGVVRDLDVTRREMERIDQRLRRIEMARR